MRILYLMQQHGRDRDASPHGSLTMGLGRGMRDPKKAPMEHSGNAPLGTHAPCKVVLAVRAHDEVDGEMCIATFPAHRYVQSSKLQSTVS